MFPTRNQVLPSVAIALALLVTGEGRAFEVADGAAARFQPTACWTEAGGPAATECGWLNVPERWDRPGQRQLKLPVVIFRPRDPDPHLAPVIHLAGGPGGSALGRDGIHLASWRNGVDDLFPGRTVVVFDQRGIGLGTPRLACPESDDPRIWWTLSEDRDRFEDVKTRLHGAIRACHERLIAEGHDLTAFNTRQSAADVEGLRRALGFDRVILFGVSYGSRLALAVMRHHPVHIAAAVLDSVYPPQATWVETIGWSYGATLERLFAACAGHERCAAAYPDLKARFLSVLDALKRQPVVLEVENLAGRAPLYARIDHLTFLAILRAEMYHTGRIHALAALIAGLAKGEHWRLKTHAENTFYNAYPKGYDIGMSLSVDCHDEAAGPPLSPSAYGRATPPYLMDFIEWALDLDLCPIWPAGSAAPVEATAVASDVPSLLLAGALDASTPVELAEMAAETLPAGHLFVFPANAHEQIFSSPCARSVLAAFLENPRTRPNPACLGSLRQPSFLAVGG